MAALEGAELGFGNGPRRPLRSALAGAPGARQSSGVAVPIQLDVRQRSLLAAAINGFASADRSRGMSYYRQGYVQALLPLDDEGDDLDLVGFAAEVQGSQLYHVEWTFFENAWQEACDCPVGAGCKHAFAAAQAMLSGGAPAPRVFDLDDGPSLSGLRGNPPPAVSEAAEIAGLTTLLEQRHGRVLRDKERRFVRDLVGQWSRLRRGGPVFGQDLVPLGLERTQGYYGGYTPVITDWWDAAEPLASPLEYWQFLALYAERTQLLLPDLMRPLTDTQLVVKRVEARERRQKIAHWAGLFAAETRAGIPAPHAGEVPREVRLRLNAPKLLWEFRAAPDAPWLVAKGARVKEWFAALATDAAQASPLTLALLQEVQLLRTRTGYWSSAEAQTLRLDEPVTRQFLHWLLVHPELRALLVNAEGEAFAPEHVRLQWLGRPLPDQPEDVVFNLVRPDGTPAPAELIQLEGQPPLAVAGRTVFDLPPPLPGHEVRPLVIPQEALRSLPALRHLRRAAVRVEGVELPEIELIPLRPRVVCTLSTAPQSDPAWGEMLEVQLLGVSPDGQLIQRYDGMDRWTSTKGTATALRGATRTRDIDRAAAEAVMPLITAFTPEWFEPKHAWVRRALAKAFPEQFAEWVERLRHAGVEIECDPALAGLARPADRARIEVVANPAEGEGSGIDWFDLEIAVRAEDTTLTDAEIRLLLKARGRFVRLAGKGWRRLQVEIGPEETARLAELGLDPAGLEGGHERQRFHALQLADERIAGLLPEAHAARVREQAERLRAIAPPPLPAGLTAELRPYQREGFHFLAHLSSNGLGGVLADDMGLGKTVQALTWLLHLAGERAAAAGAKPLRALVVCPKSVVPNWGLETQRFAAALTFAPLQDRTAVPAGVNLVVVNYAQLRLAAEKLGAERWDAVILDEGQNIKNPQSQTARVARDLRATHRLVLTGTPIENRTLDLWSLFAFAMPGLLGSQAAFRRNFNDRTDPRARSRLARRVRHFMLRRTKAQVAADLPPRIEEDLIVELEGSQRILYDAELKRTRALLLGVQTAREFDQQRFNILQSLLRLRQICCDPRLVGFDPAEKRAGAGPSGAADSAKMEALLDTLEPLIEEGHRVLVFSQFVTLLELVAAELTARKIGYLMLTGQTENRQALVDRFQSAGGEPVFLLSLKAAGTGLNLTAASYVVLFDPWWNPAVEAQAIDRTHRIGQKNQVIAYRLLARGTVEEKIRKLQHAKAELARSVVQEESLTTVMSLDDLRFVLGTDGAE